MYEIRFYKGDYRARQLQANEDGCVAYVEHHFNSSENPSAGYAVVIVGSNASQTSKNWGRWYAHAVAAAFGVKVGGVDGIMVGGYDGRGDDNVRHTNMPALLLEPLFASNPRHAEWIRSTDGRDRLAEVLVESLVRFFPAGGRVGFSVGHKYKTSSPNDRGAAVAGGGTEADYAEQVLQQAERRIAGGVTPAAERVVRVVRGTQTLHEIVVDSDADVVWDGMRQILRISEG